MDPVLLRKINLIEILSESQPDSPVPPEDAAHTWSVEDIESFFRTGRVQAGSCTSNCESTAFDGPSNEDVGQPGGGVEQHVDSDAQVPPSSLRLNQVAATVQGYRSVVLADGIRFRPHGLFPPGDTLLRSLVTTYGALPFETHLCGKDSSYQQVLLGSWTSGDSAACAGLDMRLFYKAAQGGQPHGEVFGAVRLGDKASIGNGFWLPAHGGAVESILDEATAELGKMEFSPILATTEFSIKIQKRVPLHTSLLIKCKVLKVRGVRCTISGSIINPATEDVLATCEATLVDLQQLWKAQPS